MYDCTYIVIFFWQCSSRCGLDTAVAKLDRAEQFLYTLELGIAALALTLDNWSSTGDEAAF